MHSGTLIKDALITCDLSKVKRVSGTKYYRVKGKLLNSGSDHRIYIKNGSIMLPSNLEYAMSDATYLSGQYTVRTSAVLGNDGILYASNVYVREVELDYLE